MSENPKDFDLIVIGGGPAGMVGATTAAAFGKTVAVVDSHQELGGAGANTGTVPSKTLRETALALSGMRSRNLYGVDLSLRREATVADFLRHEQNVKTGLNHVLSQTMAASHITVYCGTASFEDAHMVRVRPLADGNPPDLLLRGEHFLIAIGSAPVRPENFPFDRAEIYDSDTILDHRPPAWQNGGDWRRRDRQRVRLYLRRARHRGSCCWMGVTLCFPFWTPKSHVR